MLGEINACLFAMNRVLRVSDGCLTTTHILDQLFDFRLIRLGMFRYLREVLVKLIRQYLTAFVQVRHPLVSTDKQACIVIFYIVRHNPKSLRFPTSKKSSEIQSIPAPYWETAYGYR
jgi:hypothetical protein